MNKKLLKLAITVCLTALLLIMFAPTKATANSAVCRYTGLFCPQSIPGTSKIPITSTLQTYEYFAPLRHLGVNSPLQVSVDLSDRERNLLNVSYGFLFNRTQAQYEEDFKNCVRKYTTSYQFPTGGESGEHTPTLSSDPVENLVLLWRRAKRSPGVKMTYWIAPPAPSGAITMAQAEVGTNWQAKGFSIDVNTQASAQDNFSSMRTWGGIILHEMMHSLGYEHPEWRRGPQDVQGSMIYEATWCIARLNQDKDPDSITLMLQDPTRPSYTVPFIAD